MTKMQAYIKLLLLLVLCVQEQILFSAAAVSSNLDSNSILFIDAAEEGDLEKIEKLLEAGIDIETRDKFGWTALMRATNNEQLSVVELLLKKRANVEAKDTYFGTTALMQAAYRGNAKLVDSLCLYKADINSQTFLTRNTPLMYAALNSKEEALRHLLLLGANYNLKNDQEEDLESLLTDIASLEKASTEAHATYGAYIEYISSTKINRKIYG